MKTLAVLMTLSAVSILCLGCGSDASTQTSRHSHDQSDADHAHDEHGHGDHNHGDHNHDHSANGHSPQHGGQLIDLGRDHEFHAELVKDLKIGSVAVFVTDGEMKPVSVEQPSIKLTLTAGQQTETFELGRVSSGDVTQFASTDEKLLTLIKHKQAQGKLRIKIGGKQYSGIFDQHDHSHGHDAGHTNDHGHQH